jgi:hypothetical protein
MCQLAVRPEAMSDTEIVQKPDRSGMNGEKIH